MCGHKHDIYHINSMVVVVVGVPVSVGQLEAALAEINIDAGVSTDREISVVEIDSPCQDLYDIFVAFKETAIWPAMVAEGKYKYHSGDEWLNVNEIMVSL